MELKSRPKKYKKDRTNREKEPISINFDISVLDLFCSYIISENTNIKRSHILGIKSLFDILDIDKYYANDTEKLDRINFIKRGIEARIDYNLKSQDLIVKHISGGILSNNYTDLKSMLHDIDGSEISWVNDTVSEVLKYSFAYNDMDNIVSLYENFRDTDYKDRSGLIKQYEVIVNDIQNKFRKCKLDNSTEMPFSLRHGVFEDAMREFHGQLTNPTNKLICGMQGLNEMLSGGFESGRVYMFFGLPGEGKSITLLNLAYQLKEYNKSYKPKDPTKTPCVLFLTMENSTKETVERLFNLAVTPDKIINYSADQVINLMRTEGALDVNEDSPIDIYVKYEPGDTVDTSYLYDLVENLEDDGYEVIALIQDYVKKIKSVSNYNDVRLELGAVVNEFKVFATLKGIPVITASQLNRDATKHIDEARKATKADLVRLLGRSNIGESMLMFENIDGGFMLAPEYDYETGQRWLGIQRVKARFIESNREHIYQPFDKESTIRLIDDELYAQPVFKETLRANADQLMNRGTTQPRINYDRGCGGDTGIQRSSYQVNEIHDVGNVRLIGDQSSNVFVSPNTVMPMPSMLKINTITEIPLEDTSKIRFRPIIPV